MRAVGYTVPGPITAPEALIDLDLPVPAASGRDLLVAVQAVSVNPVDIKVRTGTTPPGGAATVLGWDAVGVVTAAGPDCRLFAAGDRVFYAGTIARPGSNAEYQLVDERIVGHAPKSLDVAEAAALPLTSITAWELLFHRLAVPLGKAPLDATLLIVGGAGGVGSMLIQFARRLTGLRVIATASREESRRWCLDLGAHAVIDHSKPMQPQLEAMGVANVAYVASLTATEQHYEALVDILIPQGKFGVIDDPMTFDVRKLKRKSISLHWESMFTRSVFGTADMIAQHDILEEVAALVDAGLIRTTLQQTLSPINAAVLRQAHAQVESGRTIGKIIVTGFAPR